MKKFYFIFAASFIFFFTSAFSQSCQWVKKINGDTVDCQSIATDKDGYLYVAGGFWSPNVTFSDSVTITDSLHRDSGFLAKYDTNGACIWAQRIGITGNTIVNNIAIDNSNNICFVGYYYNDSLKFNNGVALTSEKGRSGFIAKYNSNGLCLWANNFEFLHEYNFLNKAAFISVNKTDDIFITANFDSTITFNNGVSLSGNRDGFIAKYNANGVCQWAQKISGSGTENLRGIVANSLGDVYVTGAFSSDTLTFNSNIKIFCAISDSTSYRAYLAKYDKNGICQWAQGLTEYIYSICIDSIDNIYFTGLLASDTNNFNNNVILVSNNIHNSYYAKYNSDGLCQFAEMMTSEGWPKIYSICTDKLGSVYLAGNFSGDAVSFNNNIEITVEQKYAIYLDMFFAKYNKSGVCQFASLIHGNGQNANANITVASNGNIYLSGNNRSDTLFFNNGYFLINADFSYVHGNGFVAMYSPDLYTKVDEISISTSSMTIFPNPASDYLDISLSESEQAINEVLLYDELGDLAFSIDCPKSPSYSARIDLRAIRQGAYRVVVKTNNGIFTKAAAIIR